MTTRTRLVLLFALATAALPLLASSASAASPWWHLETASRPTYIVPGSGHPGSNEVKELIISGGPGETYGLSRRTLQELNEKGFTGPPPAEEPRYAELFVGGSASSMQAQLEGGELYGPGNVNVTEPIAGTYLIEFTGELAEQAVSLSSEVSQEFGFGGTLSLTQKTAGAAQVADGEIYVSAENLGDATVNGAGVPVKLTDVLPGGLEAVGIAATKPDPEGNFLVREPLSCEPATLTCTFTGTLVPYDSIEMRIAVNVVGPVSGANQASVSGGNAKSLSVTRPLTISGEPVPFGVHEFEMALEEDGGAPSTRAAAHPFQFTTQISLNQGRDILPLRNEAERPGVVPVGQTKDAHFNLPPGLIGNPAKFPQCTTAQFFSTTNGNLENRCPAASAVGVAVATVVEPTLAGTIVVPVPIFNMEPNFGEPARFGFYILLGGAPVFIDTAVRSGPGQDYGITASVSNINQAAAFLSSTATFWGVPGDSSHHSQRGWGCIYESRNVSNHSPCLAESEVHPPVLFSNPTTCSMPLQASVDVNSWEDRTLRNFPGTFSPSGLLTGCNQVPFGPAVSVEPTARSAAAPTGLTVDLNLKQEGLENQDGLAESDVKKVTLALPTGVTTNPSVANGLAACTLAQYEAEALGNQSCPESSKVGEVEIESPLVKPVIHGDVYVARQHDNPANNLLSIYMVAKNPELGVLVRSAGAVTPDQQTGQLTTTFDELPQLPFSHFHFAFRTGQRAPLITPGLCGKYSAQADLYSYSNPLVPLHREASFEVTSGAGGAPCATQESQLPNKPSLEAGTTSQIAGAYAPFVFKVKREDGSQPFSTISATLPEGLLGKLAGIPYCSEAQIAQAQGRSGEGQGATELASPSCPAASQVGVVSAGTGAGTMPYYVSGKAYLAGPYKGAPLSLAILTPAVVGPFDLGNVVIRTALYVDSETAQIHAVSDLIPQILHGLPTVVRSVSLNMNRSDFTLNPTSCDPKQITGSATSTLGNVAPLSQRFQVGACNALGFKPGLKVNLKGANKRGKFPALTATLTYPKGDYANIARASVALPHSEFLAQNHIRTVCTRVQFNAGAGNGAGCPEGSIYGKAKATSPLLDKPLSGPVYLRSSSHPLPDLVAALHGQIDVALVGRIDSKNGGIRSTFEAVPDAPVSKFVLEMQGGKKGLLVNSTDICHSTNRAVSKLTAQNGKSYDTDPVVTNSCGPKAKKKGKRHS